MIELKKSERQSSSVIDRNILGHFIESGFGRQVSGMWSELLFNRAFRKVTPYSFYTWEWLGFEADMYNEKMSSWHSGYEEHDWETVGSVELAETHGSNTFKGKQSLRITNPGGEGGIRQGGLHIEADRAYTFRIFGAVQGSIRTAGLDGFEGHEYDAQTNAVTIRFRDAQGNSIIENTLHFGPLQDEHVIPLRFLKTEVVSVEIVFSFEGAILLSWTSLMPDDNMKGWRKDVVELMREVKVPVVRFPGGCFVSFYDWVSSVGPRELREPMESHYWGGLEENDVGLDELMDLAELVGFEAQICFNMMSSTPYKARQIVEYLNAPADVGMGRMRMLNGYTEPRKVKLFEMDNEPWRKWSPVQYAKECVSFGEEMRLADPDVELMMACYGYPDEAIRPMLDAAGGTVNYIIQRRGDPAFVMKMLDILEQYRKDTGNHVRMVNTEWLAGYSCRSPFVSDPSVPTDYNWGRERITNDYKRCHGFFQIRWFYAVNGAERILNYMSCGGEFTLANFNNCCNTWGQNIINASKDSAWLSCAGMMFAFFGRHFIDGATSTAYETGVDGLLVQSLEKDDLKRIFLVNNTSEEFEVAVEGTYSGEALRAPDQLSTVTENDNPVQMLELNGENSIIMKPFSIAVIW